MKTLHVICNPAAKRGHTVEIYRKIRAWAEPRQDIKLSLHMTATASDATTITQELTNTDQDTYILIIGGDGTINEVVNGIVNFEHTYLMILPFGSGNDFVFTLGLKEKDPIELMNDYMNETELKQIDYLLINDKYRAVNSIGLGLSAETIKCRNKMKLFTPKTQYRIATVRKSLFWKRFVYWASFDKKPEIKITTNWFTAMNGKRIGGKVICSPDSSLTDGLISIMYIDDLPRIKTIDALSKAMNGKIKQVKYARFVNCKEFSLVLNDNCVEYDGNLLDHLNALHVKVGKEKVNIIVPKSINETNNK